MDDRTVVIIIWCRKELSDLDSLKGFSIYLGGNCRGCPCQLSPNATTTFFTHIVFFQFYSRSFAIFWVCALGPVLRLKLGGSSEIHDQNSWKESLRPYITFSGSHQGNRYDIEAASASGSVQFSKLPIINGPLKLLLFTCKIEISIVLHLTW